MAPNPRPGLRRLAFFGGTFDPPHAGHRAIAEGVLRAGHADCVLIAPALHPPHKPDRPLTPFRHRLAMLRLAFADMPGVEVSDIEDIPGDAPSFTIDTMARLAERHPDAELILLVGADSLRQLHAWHHAPELAARWPILAYPRPGEDVSLDELRRHWPEEMARRLADAVLPLPLHDLSATLLRQRLSRAEKATDPGLAGLLPPGVGEYIQRHGLYRPTADAKSATPSGA